MTAQEIKDGQVFYDFTCEGCGAQGKIEVPDKSYDFSCPARCGARYVQWRPFPNEKWRLMCVVCPVFDKLHSEFTEEGMELAEEEKEKDRDHDPAVFNHGDYDD